jgi:hypothetical protein
MFRVRAIITILLSAAIILAASSAFSASQCVGRWRVVISPSSGTCDPNERSRAILVRENGQLEIENPSTEFQLSGSVSGCQTVSLVITRGSEVAKGSGRITGEEASGTWTVTRPQSRQCSGTWYAKQH